jgi:hypothetical protein
MQCRAAAGVSWHQLAAAALRLLRLLQQQGRRLSVSIDAVLMLAGCRAVRLRASIDISWQQLHCGC